MSNQARAPPEAQAWPGPGPNKGTTTHPSIQSMPALLSSLAQPHHHQRSLSCPPLSRATTHMAGSLRALSAPRGAPLALIRMLLPLPPCQGHHHHEIRGVHGCQGRGAEQVGGGRGRWGLRGQWAAPPTTALVYGQRDAALRSASMDLSPGTGWGWLGSTARATTPLHVGTWADRGDGPARCLESLCGWLWLLMRWAAAGSAAGPACLPAPLSLAPLGGSLWL